MKLAYVLMWIALAAMGAVLLSHHYKSRYSRWMGISLIIASFGSFGVSMRESMIPFLAWAIPLSDFSEQVLVTMSIVALTIYFFTLPYFVLVLSLFFAEMLSNKRRWALSCVLLLPPLASIAYQWSVHGYTDLHLEINRLWAPIYLLIAFIVHMHTAMTEPSPLLKKNKTRIANVFGFAIVWTGVTDFWDIYRIEAGYDHYQIHSSGLWQFNVLIIGWMVIFFMYYGVRYGFLGIKLRIEQERYDFSMRALTMGTSILNHSLKNEIQKIDYLAERAREAVTTGNDSIAQQAMKNLFGVTDHMMSMVGRIKQKADDIVLKEDEESLQELIAETIYFIRPMTEEKGIAIEEELGRPLTLRCDGAHIRETLHNILMNAMEAMPAQGGTIRIRITESKREVTVSVEDTGVGIEKNNLDKVAEPFFTTKRKPTNYGLGLSYCSAVMQKHGGKLAIQSDRGRGTTVKLQFPGKRSNVA